MRMMRASWRGADSLRQSATPRMLPSYSLARLQCLVQQGHVKQTLDPMA